MNRSFFLIKISLVLLFSLSTTSLMASDNSETFKKFMKLKQNAKIGDAVEFLNDKIKSETDIEKKSLENFLLGYTQFQQYKDKEALAAFTEVVKAKSKIEDYATYYLGLTQKRGGDFSSAKASFRKVIESKAPDSIILESKYNLGLIAIDEKKFKDAETQFRILLKKWKSTEKYPEVLWQIMRVQRNLRQNFCKNAKEIYSRYPTYVGAKFWGHNLSKDVFEGLPTRCQATPKEEQSRIKYLQLGGEIDRALEELKLLRVDMQKSLEPKAKTKATQKVAQAEADNGPEATSDSSDESGETQSPPADDDDDEVLTGLYSIDSMIANVLIAQGKADEAFKLLLSYYDQQGHRSGYLQLLAKAAGRLGEYQAAASAFDKIYHLSPRSKNGKNALFQAAFLSYQFQDYDGASRKFEEFVRNFSNTSLTRDSQWHIAWLKYLKGDYEGSYNGFQKISVMKTAKFKYVRVGKRRRRQRRKVEIPTDTVTADRAKYWMAMSLYRLEKFDQARSLFESLSRDSSIGYYSIASFYRLQSFPAKAKLPANPTTQAPLGGGVAPGATPNPEAEASVGEDMRAQETTTLEEGAASDDVIDGASDASYGDGTDQSEKVLSGNFRDPVLAKRFERAQLLSQIGLMDLSRLELSEIEKHIRSQQDRKQLMEQYQTVQSYFRSSSLGEIAFSAERIRGGLITSRGLWEYAYPRAYENFVVPNAKSLSVSESLVWGIMRSESHYRSEARSPVGALGLMQLMPFTSKKVADLLGLKEFQVDKLIEPETNIKLGTRYLKRLNEKYRYVPLVAAAYNAGPHRVASWLKSFGLLDMDEFIEHIPYVETRNYVKRVVRNYQIYALLYNAKNSSAGHTLKWLAKPVDVKLPEGPLGLEVW